jgi:hypothetical protein
VGLVVAAAMLRKRSYTVRSTELDYMTPAMVLLWLRFSVVGTTTNWCNVPRAEIDGTSGFNETHEVVLLSKLKR